MNLVESIFQTTGKASFMLRAQFVHFVLPLGFMILYKIRSIIKMGKISVTSHTYIWVSWKCFDCIFCGTLKSFKTNRTLSYIPYIHTECKKPYGKGTCPWVCPRKRSAMEPLPVLTNTRVYMLEMYNGSQLCSSETMEHRSLTKGRHSGLDYLKKSRSNPSNTYLLVQ